MKHAVTIPAALIATLALSGCREQAAPPPAQLSAAAPILSAGLFTSTQSSDAKPIAEARAHAKPGDTIAIEGYIGGRAKPFTEGRAVFLLADVEKAPPCDDGCETPWDACCEPSETIIANSATVQVVDAQGAPLKLSLDGTNGLKSGAVVTVTGKVRETGERILIVDATEITIKP